MNTNIAWFMVIFGGLIECFWVSGLKYSTEIWHYILDNDIPTVEDETNQDNEFSRNLIRNEILPVILKRWPNAINAIKEKPDIPHSIKVTNISVGSDAYNVIPDEVFMAIDIRAQTNHIMNNMHEKVKKILEYITQAYNAKYNLINTNGVPAAEFDKEMISIAEKAIVNVLGPESSVGTLYNPGGEDFHYMTQRLGCKSTYIGLGADAFPGLHHKDMTLNKDVLINGVEIWGNIVEQILGQ